MILEELPIPIVRTHVAGGPSAPALAGAVSEAGRLGFGADLSVTGVMRELSVPSSDTNRGSAVSLGAGSFNTAIFVGSAVSRLLIGLDGFDAILVFGFLTTLAALAAALACR